MGINCDRMIAKKKQNEQNQTKTKKLVDFCSIVFASIKLVLIFAFCMPYFLN